MNLTLDSVSYTHLDVYKRQISRVPDAIIEKQTVDVDAVSGATYTSKGIIDAVKDALMAFAMDTGNIDVSKLADGTYEGTGEGLFGAIKVSVTVQGGKITEVKVLEHGETDGIADAAISGVSNAIVETQDPCLLYTSRCV